MRNKVQILVLRSLKIATASLFILSSISNADYFSQSIPTSADRPTITKAIVDEQYSCPLFENRPYDTLNAAIDTLTESMSSVPSACKSQKESFESVSESNRKIAESVKTLQAFVESNPQENPGDLAAVENSLQTAIQGISNIGQIFNNNQLLSSSCGKQVLSSGKVLLAINDIINNLSPYALLLAAFNPAVGATTKYVLMGGTVATSAISTMVKLIDQGTYDMTKAEQRRAVLQNACQYTKVATKVRYLQLAQSGQISKVTQDLDKNIQAYKLKYGRPSEALNKLMGQKQERDASYAQIYKLLKEDEKELNDLEQQIQDTGSEKSYLCTVGIELAKQGQNKKIFPATLINHLNSASEFTRTVGKVQLVTLNSLQQFSESRLLNFSKAGASLSNKDLETCASVSQAWIKGLRQMSKAAQDLINKDKRDYEYQLSKNDEYRIWKSQTEKLKSEQVTADRITRVMKELAKDNSVIDRSELDQRMEALRSGLFGPRSMYLGGRSPVLSWIEHTAKKEEEAISSFAKDIENIKQNAFLITPTAKDIFSRGMTTAQHRKQVALDKAARTTLSSLNLNTIPIGSREQELVCQDLENAWLDWSAALDHIGAIEFMCDMLDPYLIKGKTEDRILKYCRGTVQYNGVIRSDSELNNMKARLTRVNETSSFRKDATIISRKLNELQCPMPTSEVMAQ